MTRAERRALIGDIAIEHIHTLVAAAPAPTPQLIDGLRRILTRPAKDAVVRTKRLVA